MVNKVILVGNLGADPDLVYTKGQDAVVNFSLATTDSWNDKQTGEKKEKTEWHRCFAWGKKAEIYAKHMQKGKLYYIEGTNETSSYEKEGQKHYSTKVRVDLVRFL